MGRKGRSIILLCLVLTDQFQVAGLGAATAVTSTVYALLLLIPMERQGQGVLSREMVQDLVKMLLCAVIMGLCAFLVLSGAERILPANKIGETAALALCALSGAAVYFVLALGLGLGEAKLSVSLIKQILKRG